MSKLDNTMNELKSTGVKMILGDFNAKVGTNRIENIIGPHGLGKINECGEHQVE